MERSGETADERAARWIYSRSLGPLLSTPIRAIVNRLRSFEATDPEWDAWVETAPHDIYHSAAYHRVPTFVGDGTPQLLIYGAAERFVAWPYLLQPIPDSAPLVGGPAHDVTSTYGYSGPLVRGCEPGDPLIAEAWSRFQEVWSAQHVVSVFTRFHPILQNHRWFIDALDGPSAAEHGLGLTLTGQTVSIDLSKSDDEITGEYPRVFRQEIAQSRRKGLVTSLDTDWAYLPTFVDLYTETMERNRAQSGHFIGRDYFDDLVAQLGQDVFLFVTLAETGLAAACLFLSHHGILHPHLAGTATEFLRMSPLKVLLDDVRRWAADRGDRIMHLGGGRGGSNDSLFAFKARFSPDRQEFYTGRWILDRPRYDRLAGVVEGDDDGSGFFPRYRAPRSLE